MYLQLLGIEWVIDLYEIEEIVSSCNQMD